MHTRRRPSRGLALAAAGFLLLALSAAPGAARAEDSLAREGGLAAGSFFATIPYGLAKTLWATGGMLGAGMAWAFTGGDAEPAVKIMDGAVRGDWVVTPEHLTGKRSLDFIGRSPENQRARTAYEQPEAPPSW